MDVKIVILIIILVVLIISLFSNNPLWEHFEENNNQLTTQNLTVSGDCIDTGQNVVVFYAIGKNDSVLYTKVALAQNWISLNRLYKFTSFDRFDENYVAVINGKTGVLQESIDRSWKMPLPNEPNIFRYAKINPRPKYIIIGTDNKLYTRTAFTEPVTGPISNSTFKDMAYDVNTNLYVGVGTDGYLYTSPVLDGTWKKIPDANVTESIAISGSNYYGIGNDFTTMWTKSNLQDQWKVAGTSNIPIDYISIVTERKI